MQLHEIRPKKRGQARKRIGRGGKKGTYSGKGIKGQRSRAGRKFKPIIRDLIKRYPKLRGSRQETRSRGEGFKFQILNLDVLERKFNSGEKVNLSTLLEKRLIAKMKGKVPRVKILGKGEITKPLIIEDCALSTSAKEKIKKAGGEVNNIKSIK